MVAFGVRAALVLAFLLSGLAGLARDFVELLRLEYGERLIKPTLCGVSERRSKSLQPALHALGKFLFPLGHARIGSALFGRGNRAAQFGERTFGLARLDIARAHNR